MNHAKYKTNLIETSDDRLHWFIEQFAFLRDLDLDESSDIVTLGARFGEEVEALHTHGFTKSFGIDLKDHPPYVVKHDMNAFVKDEPANKYDLVYTNALDHCWDINELIEGIERISKRYILIHVSRGMREYEVYRLDDSIVDLFSANLLERVEYIGEEVNQNCGNSYRFLFEVENGDDHSTETSGDVREGNADQA